MEWLILLWDTTSYIIVGFTRDLVILSIQRTRESMKQTTARVIAYELQLCIILILLSLALRRREQNFLWMGEHMPSIGRWATWISMYIFNANGYIIFSKYWNGRRKKMINNRILKISYPLKECAIYIKIKYCICLSIWDSNRNVPIEK